MCGNRDGFDLFIESQKNLKILMFGIPAQSHNGGIMFVKRRVPLLIGIRVPVFFTGRGTLLPQCTKVSDGEGRPVNIWGFPSNVTKNSVLYRSDFAVRVKKRSTRWAKSEFSVFAPPSVCNIFLVAKLRYVMHTLHCARKTILVFH